MTRFLFATMPAAGHVGPLVPVASELIARGHSVAWYTGADYRAKVEATGATFHPHVHAPDRDPGKMDAEFPDRAELKGIAKFKFDIREVFIAAVPGQVADLEALLDAVRPDVIVAEPGVAAAARVVEQRHGIPWAACNISAFAMRSADTAPFGLGLEPLPSRVGRLRDRVLHALIYHTLYRSIDREYDAMRRSLDMEGAEGGARCNLSWPATAARTTPSTCSSSSPPRARRCSPAARRSQSRPEARYLSQSKSRGGFCSNQSRSCSGVSWRKSGVSSSTSSPCSSEGSRGRSSASSAGTSSRSSSSHGSSS